MFDFIYKKLKSKKTPGKKLSNKEDLTARIKELEETNSELAAANKELALQKIRLDMAMEGSSEGFWDWNIKSGETFYSNHWYDILGYDLNEKIVNFQTIIGMIHPDDLPIVLETVQSNTDGQLESYDREDRFITRDGELKWLHIHGKIVEYDTEGKPVRMSGIVKDISERKKHEEEINYLSFHDKLTGLYNRAYFERELEKCIREKQPFSLLMGDVNGLKIANDVFGHEAGDQLLISVATILTNSCRQDDIISRYGGDEFAIILKNADEAIISEICTRIAEWSGKCNKCVIKPSVAIGWAMANKGEAFALSVLVKTAEEKMYRNKLLADRSIHSSIINSLKQTLTEKSGDTEEHALRISELCRNIGQSIGMKKDELDQLALAAILHDIGKVAIPDEILLKPGPLDGKEWDVMKHHTEIGYRIAKVSPDLSHIADVILAHHERYDGKGYPQGLKSDDIPLISRILAVVDSYDAMIHNRPYRDAISEEQALAEISRCSGSQFDPHIVEAFLKLPDVSVKERKSNNV